ncbi:hypothetical protein GQ457_02G025780 [Hibiscus cannabinus]
MQIASLVEARRQEDQGINFCSRLYWMVFGELCVYAAQISAFLVSCIGTTRQVPVPFENRISTDRPNVTLYRYSGAYRYLNSSLEFEYQYGHSSSGLTGFTALEGYFDDVGSILEGKPIWEVRTRNWKLREGESRLSGLLEGISIASLGKARRQGGSSITLVQVRVSVPFDTGIGTTPLSTDTGSLEQFLGVLGSMISCVLVPELAVYDFMSLNDSFDLKFHTRACKTTNYVLVTLK